LALLRGLQGGMQTQSKLTIKQAQAAFFRRRMRAKSLRSFL
jgi:hypothetical protein